MQTRILIAGAGTYIPETRILNDYFLRKTFYDKEGNRIVRPGEDIVKKFEDITGIKERRYARSEEVTSDLATKASFQAIEDAQIQPSQLNYVVVAHNFGDVRPTMPTLDMVPSLASRVARNLDIENASLITYDIAFGCPGWIEGVINVINRMKPGEYALVVGAETLSRVYDPYDRDSMIFSDGAGAVVLKAIETERDVGFLGWESRSYAGETVSYLYMSPSYKKDHDQSRLYMHMEGRKVYEFALKEVPSAIKGLLDKKGLHLKDTSMFLIHQANAKMDHAILKRLLRLYGMKKPPREYYMPMTIQSLGNSSVATIPTMIALIKHKKLLPYEFEPGDIVIMASVGAGMNINAMLYKW
ncbi:MAG: ketoacyl-ACP synthase III [Chlorobi bacterium]|nr:ketoacyl-ACP synthase III [Chlorobiota bacterium]